VGGEVKNSGRFPYLGEITVLRAIDSAGGFTDFARRNAIELRRASGESHTVDWKRAKKNPKLDLPIYPNDQIIVPQRLY
jgi:polysaccharide export outer membrane protein